MKSHKRKKAGKWPKILVTLAIIAVIVIGLIIFFSKWANSSNSVNIQTESPAQAAPAATTYQAVKTPFFTTVVPSTWQIQDNNNSVTPNIVALVAFAPSGGHGQVGFSSYLLTQQGIAGVGDYNLRIKDTVDYKPFTDPSFPAGSYAFKETAGNAPEETLFLTHGDRYAAITISDDLSDNDTLALLKTINSQWQWL